MKFNEIKQRLDPACWHNKKIGNPKTKIKGGVRVNNCVPKEGVAEGASDTIYPGAEVIKTKRGKPVGEIYQDASGWGCHHYKADLGADCIESREEAIEWLKDLNDEHRQDRSLREAGVAEAYGPWGKKTPQDIERIRKHQEREKKNTTPGQLRKSEPAITKRNSEKAMSYFASLEEYNAEYDDEAGMAQGSLHTLQNAVEGLQQVIDAGDNLPEWCQEKISLAEDYLVTVWDYIQSEKAQGVDPEISEEFDMIERIIESIAAQNGVDAEAVWTDLESLTEDELYAFAVTSQLNEDWSKVNKKDKTDGMSRKAVKAYRRENPGSKLQTAVTTKPSKLKKGSKASKRRKSYCSRSKGQMNMHNISCAKTPDKAICKARRRWNC